MPPPAVLKLGVSLNLAITVRVTRVIATGPRLKRPS